MDEIENKPPEERPFQPTLLKGRRFSLKGKTFLIPSLVTVAAFFSGFVGVIAAVRGDYLYATKAIALAILFDGLDGRVARRLNAATAFGREFDSLSDVVSFGVAPAILAYCWAFQSSAGDFGVLAAFVYTVCAGARLARFNVDTETTSSRGFVGLPSPGAAVGVIALVYWHPLSLEQPFFQGVLSLYLMLLGGLMVSELPYSSVKNLKFTPATVRRNILVMAVIVGFAWYSSQLAVLIGGVGYALSGGVAAIARTLFPEQVKRFSRRERKILFGG